MSRLAGLAFQAARWLVDPPPSRPAASTVRDFGSPATKFTQRAAPRPVVAVVGLAPGCGASTAARALAATLARRDHAGAAIVAGGAEAPGSSLARPSASRLARRLDGAARGRLCITAADASTDLARLAPVVLDVPHGIAPPLPTDLTILLVPGNAEPALAYLAAKTLGEPLAVVNRASDPERWAGRVFAHLPHSRGAAWLAAAGWEPRGAFGAAIAKLADACEEAACV